MTTLEMSPSIKAQQVTGRGGFELACNAERAFPLFSPEGERLWIREWKWDPQPVFPETIAFRRDTVFRQGAGADEAIWTIVDVDSENHRAEYVRVAPASHAAHIIVKVDATGPESCRVNVEYTATAYTEHGYSMLDSFSKEGFLERMRSWKRQIDHCLNKN
jgi:hypothetical protein